MTKETGESVQIIESKTGIQTLVQRNAMPADLVRGAMLLIPVMGGHALAEYARTVGDNEAFVFIYRDEPISYATLESIYVPYRNDCATRFSHIGKIGDICKMPE